MSPYFQASKNKLEETATRLPPMDTAHKHRSWAESRAFSSYHMQVESFRMDPLLLSRTGTDTRHNGCARSRSHRNCNNWFMILLAFVLVVAMAGTTHARVTLLFTNAVNGRLVDTNGVGGFARIKSVFGQYPAGSTVRINGHGFIGGGAASDIAAAGAAETDVMNTLSYHASGIGTRELGIGPASLSTSALLCHESSHSDSTA
ncbi:hypothetical protein BC828DRAFT_91370 [Blastocladiella britannica]|nr:hypothetical protein BC828DRAFT_91370 [Blastocladiella britannica]